MWRKKIGYTILYFVNEFKNPYYHGFAAQLAFYFMLSVIPMLVVLSQVLGLFSISLEYFAELVEAHVSTEIAGFVMGLIETAPSGVSSTLFVILAVWAASKAQFSLMRITNYIFTGGRSTGNGYFRERVRAVKSILFTIVTLSAGLILFVYGDVIIQIFIAFVTDEQDVKSIYELNSLWSYLKWPLAMLMYFIMVSYNYYMLPSERLPFKEIIPGSAFASVAMLLSTGMFSMYAVRVMKYDIIYGSLASAIAIMLWFYVLAWSLGLGLMFNKGWEYGKAQAERRAREI